MVALRDTAATRRAGLRARLPARPERDAEHGAGDGGQPVRPRRASDARHAAELRRGWTSATSRSCSPSAGHPRALLRAVAARRLEHACSPRSARARPARDRATFALLGPGRHRVRCPPGVTPIACPTRIVHLCRLPRGGRRARGGRPASGPARGSSSRPLSGRPASDSAGAARRDRSAPPVEQVERLDARCVLLRGRAPRRDNPPDAPVGSGCSIGCSSSPPRRSCGARRRARRVSAAEPRSGPRRSGRPASTIGHWRVVYGFGRRGADRLRLRRCGARRARTTDAAADALRAVLDRDADGPAADRRAPLCAALRPGRAAARARLLVADRACRRPSAAPLDRRPARPGARPDGSLPIHIQHAPPARGRRSNWLPVPAGRFSIALRPVLAGRGGAAAPVVAAGGHAVGLTALPAAISRSQLDRVQRLGLFGRREPDLDQVQRADEAVADAEASGARDRVAQRHGPVVLDQHQRGGGVVRDVLQRRPSRRRRRRGRSAALSPAGAELQALLAFDPEADQRADDATELPRLVVGQVAEVRDLDAPRPRP